MTNPLSWSTTAASNTSVAGVSIAEGWAPASVNNSIRGMMSDLAKMVKDQGGDLITTGTPTAYAITTNMGIAIYAKPLTLMAKAHITSTGAATLSVDGLAAKAIKRSNGDALAPNDMVLGGICIFVYEPTADVFFLINPATATTFTSVIPPGSGGTGITSYAIGDMLYATAATTLAKLPMAAVGNALLSGATAPSWGPINLTTHVTGLLPIANGGTGAVDIATARDNLGLELGVDVQAYDATLAGLATLTTIADQAIYSTGANTFAMTSFSPYGRSLVDDLDGAAARVTLGLGTMSTQAASAVAITGGAIDADTLVVNGDPVATLAAANAFTAPQTITLATTSAVPLTLISTEAGAGVGPTLNLFRDSVSPFANDVIGALTFTGRDSANVLTGYGTVQASVVDATDGSEDGRVSIATINGGTVDFVAQFGPGLAVGAPTGGDKGLGTVNASGYYEQGVRFGLGQANFWTAAQTITLATAAAIPLTLTSTEAGATVGPTLNLFRDSASPATNDVLGAMTFTGRNSVNAAVGYATIQGAMLDVTSGSEDGRVTVATLVGGAPAVVAQFGAGLIVGNPTGGDKGVGTVNATGVYDDNTLLTGYVLEAAIDGSIDKPKWDKIGIRGVHEPMRRFSAMVETGSRNPLTIDGFGDFWKTYRHLPSLPDEEQPSLLEQPSTGQWIQMLVETVELLAVHLDGVHQRLERLEEEFGSGSDYSRA